MELKGADVLVIGMAKSGLASIGVLREKGARVTASDSKALDELPGVAETLERFGAAFAPQRDSLIEGRDLVVVSPGVPFDLAMLLEARRRGIPVIGDVELASWFLKGPVIGITGANGKTTTTALVGHILTECGVSCQVGGNIGTSPAAMIPTSREDQWNVLELSSFQLEAACSFHAKIGTALNVTPDHLDRHHTFEAYAAAKGRLFETQQAGDFAVLNADDPTCVAYAALTKGEAVWFRLKGSVPRGAWLQDGRILFDGEPVMEAAEIPLKGMHNVENVMAGVAMARLAGAGLPGIAAAVKTFPGVEHRIEYTRTLDGVEYYNDSKATNVDATLKAIDSFPGGLWIILGGKDKGSDYHPLIEPLRRKAKGVLLVGAAAEKIANHLGGAVPVEHAGTIERALDIAHSRAEAGDVVLLAPACASFDQFNSYEHRGRVFKDLVRRLS